MGFEQQVALAGRAAERHGGGDETLHQVTLRRPDIRFEDFDPGPAQHRLQVHQLAMLRAVQAEHRAVLEVLQPQRPQFHTRFAAHQLLGAFTVQLGDKRH